MVRRKLASVTAGLLVLVSFSPSHAAANGKVEEILGNMQAAASKIKTLQARLSQEKRNPQIGGSERYRGEIIFGHFGRNDDKVRINYEMPRGQVVVVNQFEITLYQQSINQCFITSRRSAGSRNEELAFFSAPYSLTPDQIKSRYAISYLGDEHVGGSPASVLELVPRGPSNIVKLKWWVSHATWLPVKSQAVERDAVTTFSLSNTITNGPIDRRQFNFKCPSGSEIVRR